MRITKYGHACLLIEEGAARILIDPGAFSLGYEKLKNVDAVFVTHQHADHSTDETLDKVRAQNPDVAVYADAGTARIRNGDEIEAVKAGDEILVKGVTVRVYGEDHAVIHPDIPGIENVGYLVGERFFYPGDNFTRPDASVEILALPLGAPWLKISEVVDYLLDVKPKVAFGVHDAVLAMPKMNIDIVKRFSDPAGINFQMIENGGTVEF